jgi:UDP-N-acetylglucosamine acyltransferase
MACLVAETARVDPRARLAEDVEIGPGCLIGPEVVIGRGTRLLGQVCLLGVVVIGEFNTIGPYVAIGSEPQDYSYWGTPTRVEIGDHNTVGERVTIHRASEKEDGITRLGNSNQLLPGAHIAHDCKLADGISIGALTMLGGHVHVESGAVISEKVGVHQFVTVGTDCFIGGQSKITQDVPRYMRVDGNPPKVLGINGRRLARKGLAGSELAAIREAHQLIFLAKMTLLQAADIMEAHGHLTPEVLLLIKFLDSQHQGRMGRGRERRKAL